MAVHDAPDAPALAITGPSIGEGAVPLSGSASLLASILGVYPGAGDGIEPALSAWESVHSGGFTCPELRSWLSAGMVAGELEASADFHFLVHNAAGMVSVQLGISVTDALIRLGAYAFTRDRLLTEMAQDVIARRLRLE